MKRSSVSLSLLATLSLLGGLIAVGAPEQARANGGDDCTPVQAPGQEGDNYQISTAGELKYVANNSDFLLDESQINWWAQNFVLANDISLTGCGNWEGIGRTRIPGARDSLEDFGLAFTGVFDGQGNSISGLTITTLTSYREGWGLFGWTAGAELKGINLVNVSINLSTGEEVGALVGRARDRTNLVEISASGLVKGAEKVGGIVGEIEDGIVSDSVVSVNVESVEDYAGGLIGRSVSSTIVRSHAHGDVKGGKYVGGLVGAVSLQDNSQSWDISHSSASGDVSGGDFVGGLVGEMSLSGVEKGSIANSFALGNVKGKSFVGGLVGKFNARESAITDSYAEGNVTGEYPVGGLVGEMERGDILRSYATGSVVGAGDAVGGLVGEFFGRNIIDSSFEGQRVYNKGSITGGLVGNWLGDGEILRSFLSSDVISEADFAGGLVGAVGFYADDEVELEISQSFVVGDVRGGVAVGGLIGIVRDSEDFEGLLVEYSYFDGEVRGEGAVGGLIGEVLGETSISNSYATGIVNGLPQNSAVGVAGLVGYVQAPMHIDRVYTAAAVNFPDENTQEGTQLRLVGFVGVLSFSGEVKLEDIEVTNSFWIQDSSDVPTWAREPFFEFEDDRTFEEAAGYLARDGSVSSIVAPASKTFDTYSAADWAIVDGWASFSTNPTVWGICSAESDNPDVNDGYPFLLWQYDSNPCVEEDDNGNGGNGEDENGNGSGDGDGQDPNLTPDPTPSAGGTSTVTSPEKRAGSAGIHLDLQAKVGDTVAGSPVVIGGQGLFGGSAYSLVVRSTPQTLASGRVSALGNFSTRATLPALPVGSHTLTLTATALDGSVLSLVQTFTVSANGTFSAIGSTSGTQTGGLAATGVNGVAGGMGLAGVALFLGLAMVMTARRYQMVS